MSTQIEKLREYVATQGQFGVIDHAALIAEIDSLKAAHDEHKHWADEHFGTLREVMRDIGYEGTFIAKGPCRDYAIRYAGEHRQMAAKLGGAS